MSCINYYACVNGMLYVIYTKPQNAKVMTPPAKSAYRLVHRHKEQLVLDMVFDPIDGSEKERVCYMPTRDRTKKLTLLRHSEVDKVMH